MGSNKNFLFKTTIFINSFNIFNSKIEFAANFQVANLLLTYKLTIKILITFSIHCLCCVYYVIYIVISSHRLACKIIMFVMCVIHM